MELQKVLFSALKNDTASLHAPQKTLSILLKAILISDRYRNIQYNI